MLRRMRQLVLPALFVLASLPASGAGFAALSMPGSQLGALSADGRVAAGGLVGGASGGFRWREGEGAQALAGAMSVRAISASGRYAAGSSLDASQREVATWWDPAGVAHPVGGFSGADARAGVLSVAYGVTDEPRVVGVAVDAQKASTAFAWSEGDGLSALDSAGTASAAAGISSDGRRVYGWSERADSARRGVVWNLGHLCCAVETGASANELIGANRGATLLLGFVREERDRETPYRWSPDADDARKPFAAPPAPGPMRFNASSDDGSLLAGATGSGAKRVAVVWTPQGGVERLDSFLAARHVAVPEGWTLMAATAVSANGHRLGGFGLKDGRFDSFVIDLPPSVAGAAAHASPAP
jgi:hypothetical protein